MTKKIHDGGHDALDGACLCQLHWFVVVSRRHERAVMADWVVRNLREVLPSTRMKVDGDKGGVPQRGGYG